MRFSTKNLPIFNQNQTINFVLPEQAISNDFDRMKRKLMSYRLIFVFLGVLFAYLTLSLHFQAPNWTFHQLFNQGSLAKGFLTGMSALLTLTALWFGCHARTSIELAKRYTKEATFRMKLAYREMKDRITHENYHLALLEIESRYQETLHHIHRIQDLQLSDTAKRKMKITHLKNLKDYLEEARIAI